MTTIHIHTCGMLMLIAKISILVIENIGTIIKIYFINFPNSLPKMPAASISIEADIPAMIMHANTGSEFHAGKIGIDFLNEHAITNAVSISITPVIPPLISLSSVQNFFLFAIWASEIISFTFFEIINTDNPTHKSDITPASPVGTIVKGKRNSGKGYQIAFPNILYQHSHAANRTPINCTNGKNFLLNKNSLSFNICNYSAPP